MDKKVVILVIVALLLAVFSITFTQFGLGEKVSTVAPVGSGGIGSGRVGIEIIPQTPEEKPLVSENG